MNVNDNIPVIEIVSKRSLKVVKKYQKTYLILEAKYKEKCLQ
jgi:hypothetical protein